MPKIKLPRKSTHIDMTAMCDVAFLLLSFFMLATKFKTPEPVEIRTAASVSTDDIPNGFMLISLDKTGRVFFGIDNDAAKRDVITAINTDKDLKLNQNQIESFVKLSSVGVPFSQLNAYLSATPEQQMEMDKSLKGIPTDTANSPANELAYWISASRDVLPEGGRIAIKADGESNYPEIHKVIETLAKLNIFRFSFITDMKGVPPGTALAEEMKGSSGGAAK